MNGCKHRINAKCTLFSNEWAESRCHIKNEMDCPYHDPVSITNADRIRALTDEELAEWIAGRYPDCPPGVSPAPLGCDDVCAECWLEWLRKEADNA